MSLQPQVNACVVIPFYRSQLPAFERASLERCLSVLGAYPLVLVKPESLDVTVWLARYPQLRVESFADEFFRGVAGYNRLMLSDHFYARFARHEFMLIHQLDAFVFEDRLADWCERNYDFIGAPWLPDVPFPRGWERARADCLRIRSRWKNLRSPDGRNADPLQFHFAVGNGGFSLRRIATMRKTIANLTDRIAPYLEGELYTFNEDIFFAVEANRRWPRVRTPGPAEACFFSWEVNPWIAASVTRGHLPFGCHAWNKHYREFWRLIFNRLGYDIDALIDERDDRK